jgi:metal-responsive CopG/Arc/MetJ family transcriptional regulator
VLSYDGQRLVYKYISKTRLGYQEKHQVKDEEKIENTSDQKIGQQQFDDAVVQQETICEQQELENLEQHKIVIKQQREEVKVLRKELARLKEQKEDIWTANGTVHFGDTKLLLIITVDSKQRRIVDVALDLNNDRSIEDEWMNNKVE